MKWGIVDTETGLWLGDDTGPKVFDSAAVGPDDSLLGERAYILARVAAELADIRLGWPPGRCRAREMTDDAKRLHDALAPTMTTLEALRLKEKGLVW